MSICSLFKEDGHGVPPRANFHPIMAHSLAPVPTISPSTTSRNKNNAMVDAAAQRNKASLHYHLRREFVYSLIASGLASSVVVERADAKRKPPPPPPTTPEEKKDPSITGVRAKVLASIKRKEAMKEEIAKLREKGKPVS